MYILMKSSTFLLINLTSVVTARIYVFVYDRLSFGNASLVAFSCTAFGLGV